MDPTKYALGMIETIGLTSIVAAADEAVKAANVKVLSCQKPDAGIVTVYLGGDVASVRAAVEAGALKAKEIGEFRSYRVIPKPDPSVFYTLGILPMPPLEEEQSEPFSYDSSEVTHETRKSYTKEELELLSVKELKQLARLQGNFPLSGTDISMAKKSELIEKLVQIMEERGENSNED
ncbi:BMC domain-containing protein [Bacillus songklensis]|uniref:BMC domain-containing protein n=1 Tax=Bacillus songklensis TaxID=1069116 RepID=A0ABV8B7F8_9BACI